MCIVVFFFFKQKTAYEMRISDWSSDVCLPISGAYLRHAGPGPEYRRGLRGSARSWLRGLLCCWRVYLCLALSLGGLGLLGSTAVRGCHEIGRASGRERVCQYV